MKKKDNKTQQLVAQFQSSQGAYLQGQLSMIPRSDFDLSTLSPTQRQQIYQLKPRRDEHIVLCKRRGLRCAKKPEVLEVMRVRRAKKRAKNL